VSEVRKRQRPEDGGRGRMDERRGKMDEKRINKIGR